MQRNRQRFIVPSGSSSNPIFIGGTTTTTTTQSDSHNPVTDAFCENCSDWLKPEGWQDDGRYYCLTCFKYSKLDIMWKK